MSQYIYAIIPYDSGMKLSDEEKEQGIYAPYFPVLDSIDSEFTEESLYSMLEEYIRINTCYRQSAFTNNKDGYCWIRSEICQIAKALGAKEVWYVAELSADAMMTKDFSFSKWKEDIKGKDYTVRLTTDVLKGNAIYSYYHDDFSDIIMERPQKEKCPKKRDNK